MTLFWDVLKRKLIERSDPRLPKSIMAERLRCTIVTIDGLHAELSVSPSVQMVEGLGATVLYSAEELLRGGLCRDLYIAAGDVMLPTNRISHVRIVSRQMVEFTFGED